jgi:hypothetical protein
MSEYNVDNDPAPDEVRRELQHGFKFGLSCIAHVFFLFLVLLTAYMVLLANISKAALEGEIDRSLKETLKTSLEKANEASGNELHTRLTPLLQPLETVRKLYEGPDPASAAFNRNVYITAWVVAGALLAIMVAMVLSARYGGNMTVWKSFFAILFTSFIGVLVAASAETAWFLFVGKKYIPTTASAMGQAVVDAVKANV